MPDVLLEALRLIAATVLVLFAMNLIASRPVNEKDPTLPLMIDTLAGLAVGLALWIVTR